MLGSECRPVTGYICHVVTHTGHFNKYMYQMRSTGVSIGPFGLVFDVILWDSARVLRGRMCQILVHNQSSDIGIVYKWATYTSDCTITVSLTDKMDKDCKYKLNVPNTLATQCK